MVLRVIGSSSSGNGYLLVSDDEALIIEMGIPFMDVKKALDFNVSKIVGAVASHVHGDHFAHHAEYEKAGIPTFYPFQTDNRFAKFGGFTVQSFPVPHSVPCYGFMVKHKEIGKLVFMTDLEYCGYTFKDVSHLMVEANYGADLVDRDEAQYAHRMLGHCSIDTALGIVAANKSEALRTVTLLHLSDTAADADQFVEAAEKVAGCPVRVARKGLEVEL